ncbi:22695_t:CDS:1, partial [Gigaspora margarita]
ERKNNEVSEQKKNPNAKETRTTTHLITVPVLVRDLVNLKKEENNEVSEPKEERE